ncbi:MAG: hypothetical protein HYS32_01655 [Candidatus Woesearchaeota archaeon]|nr:MAG: hypothetical protein HYS32_01655 [Candidatus Woesearchaeota archaeon]
MAIDFETAFFAWQSSGLFTVVLPFLLVFTLVFAVLQKVKILGEDKRVNVIIAIIVGLLILQSNFAVAAINNFLPNIALVLVVAIMFIVVLGLLFVGDDDKWKGVVGGWSTVIAVIGIFWALTFDSFNEIWNLPPWLFLSDSAKATLLVIFTIIVVIWLVTRDSESNKEDSFYKVGILKK